MHCEQTSSLEPDRAAAKNGKEGQVFGKCRESLWCQYTGEVDLLNKSECHARASRSETNHTGDRNSLQRTGPLVQK
jgi:hypothetical protein